MNKRLILLFIIILLIAPTPGEGLVNRPYWVDEINYIKDIKININLENTVINNGDSEDLIYSDLGENLRVVINIASGVELRLTVESINGVIFDNSNSIFEYNETVEGPSLVIKLKNQWELLGKAARLSGSIKIIHEYYIIEQVKKFAEVNATVWRPWWFWFIT